MRPRAVFFDLDDTLIDRAGAFARYVDDLISRYPHAFPETRGAVAELHALDGRGSIDRSVFCRGVVTTFPGLRLTPEALWADMSSRLPGFIQPVDGPGALVKSLRQRAPVAVVSNGSGRVQRAKMDRAELTPVLSNVFLSGEVGADKPDPRIFLAALAAVDRRPEEVLHIGDDPERDIVGAVRLGLSTCWVSHGRTWPDGLPRPTFTVERIIGNLAEVSRVLAQWT
ncbi:HAD family hydrolase [Pyxidicoccus fallax]|uniref:HAD family hydrolase n=1 Tax=Pyxidicoccus fallax TaxID=394095 RepID=A0A848LYX7_9BACT|nr:HAD family hydrolase [Pyxidicoccus fallax]NMO23398.1 HAD family hydrolase [Pyxidicoccus fallax]NPC86518.1 HAD family hydrolase [Pyxidicoccus fallax]